MAISNITDGYKQTEIGVIPEDWEVDKIKKFASILTGSKNTQDKVEDGIYPFFVRSQTVERINSYSSDGEAVLTAGDGVGTGKVFHYINGKCNFHQRVYKISNFNEKLMGYYFFLYFSTYFLNRIMQMTAKSSVDSVRMEMIADMLIPIPPISEQSAIATAFSDTDSLITSLEQLIAKKRAIKQGAMEELLTGKRRLFRINGGEGKYKQTEVGVIPEDWHVKRLGEIGSFSKGKGIKKTDVISYGYPCIRYGEIYTHYNEYIKRFYSFISSEIAKESQRIKQGDLLFAGSGETAEEIGKCVAYLENKEAYAGGDIIIFSPFETDSRYLSFLMNHKIILKQKTQMAQGDAVVHIYSNNLSKIILPIPPTKAEQTAIAEILSDMDTEIETLEQKLEKYKKIKQGMMQELLTGRTRLI